MRCKLEQERKNQIKANQNDDGKLLREEKRKLYEEIQMLQQQKRTLALEESKQAEMHLLEEEKYMKLREKENHKMKGVNEIEFRSSNFNL